MLRVRVLCLFGPHVEEGGVELVDVVREEVGAVDLEAAGLVEAGGVEGLLVEAGGGHGAPGGFGLGEVVVQPLAAHAWGAVRQAYDGDGGWVVEGCHVLLERRVCVPLRVGWGDGE